MSVGITVSRSRRFRPSNGRTPQTLRSGLVSRATLLAGSSALALALAANPAYARQLGVASAVSATTFATESALATSEAAANIARQGQNALMRATQAIQSMQAVQAAARNAAASGPNNLHTGLLTVTDGLSSGGLVPIAPSSWVGASAPTQATSNGQTTVSIIQSAPQALLNWQQFNIGKNTILNFDQGGNAAFVAVNLITDPTGRPSQILGSIRADGSVYVINPNGIIFGGSSQINVATLIASSLNLTNVTNFLSNGGLMLGGSATFSSVDGSGNPLYAAGDVTVQAGAQITAPYGKVVLLAPNVVNDGAINTPSGQTLLFGGTDVALANGDAFTRGFVVLPNLSAPNDGFSPPPANAQLLAPPQLPMFNASFFPGTVVNNGSISAPQGNITITAGRVAQNGVLTSTTSTNANGSINLTAQTGMLTLGGINDNPLYAQFGVAPQLSVVQILPDATDQSLVQDTQAIANSSITLTGASVDIRGLVQLRGYDITNPDDHPGGISIVATGTDPTTIGQVYLEDGSILDSSGTTDGVVSASRNSVMVQLLSHELADSPVIKVGPLYQQTIFVDSSASGTNADGTTWQGTAIANASDEIAGVGRSLDERMMNGAPITISGATVNYPNGGGSNGSGQPGVLPVNLVQSAGSIINISGGFLTFTAGFVKVSTLIEADGRLVSASEANPNEQYLGICCSFTVDHARWGVTQTYNGSLMRNGYEQASYIQGGAGGSLTLDVQSAILDGQLFADVLSGEKQRTVATAPLGAGLSINSIDTNTELSLLLGTAFNADNITVSNAQTAATSAWFKSASADPAFALSTFSLNALFTGHSVLANSVFLQSAWLNGGVSNVNLGANANILVPAGNAILLPAFGSLSASANNVDVESSITAPSGTITLNGAFTTASTSNANFTNVAAGGNPNGTTSITSGLVTIGSGVTLSAAGDWTNDVGATSAAPIAVNGNAIDISSTNNIDIDAGAVFDVSGGGFENSAGKITAGNAGTLTLAAGQPAVTAAFVPQGTPVPTQAGVGTVNFVGGLQPGQLRGFGISGPSGTSAGGSLNITSMAAFVDGAIDPVAVSIQAASAADALIWQGNAVAETGGAGVTFIPLNVSTDFFSSGGFANISLTAPGIELPSGVTLTPTVASLAIGNSATPSGTVASATKPILLAAGLRPASSTTLHSVGELWRSQTFGVTAAGTIDNSVDPTFALDIAGTIQTDPRGSVTLTGDQLAIVSGVIDAPGGSINFGGGTFNNRSGPAGSVVPVPLDGEGVWLTGQLIARGAGIAVPQQNGTVFLDVLPGGQVNVSGGDVILTPGSLIDVSGNSGLSTLSAAGSVALARFLRSDVVQQPSTVASAAGSISISAIIGGVLEGDLLGESGGAGAAGGTLKIAQAVHGGNSDNSNVGGFWPKIEPSFITLQQSLQPGDSDFIPADLLLPGVNPAAALISNANITVAADMVSHGGFASLNLNALGLGGLKFSGSTRLTLPDQLIISAVTIAVPNAAAAILSANYVQWNDGPLDVARPLAGTGSLTINANNVDLVGNLAVQGAAVTTFNVTGDLRLNAVPGGTVQPDQANLFSGYVGSLLSAQDLVFNTGQIYPSTGTTFTLSSATSITFEANGAPPTAPLSAGGVLNVFAPVIAQGGMVRAPGGAINLGDSVQSVQAMANADPFNSAQNGITSGIAISVALNQPASSFLPGQPISLSFDGVVANGIVTGTQNANVQIDITSLTRNGVAVQSISAADAPVFTSTSSWTVSTAASSVSLNSGSLTSVALGAQTVPYGYVLNDTWFYTTLPNTTTGQAVTAPPAKQITLAGGDIVVQQGATVDASGGGDLYASTFVPGTGGTSDIFTRSNVFAVIPGYTGLMPYDPGINTAGPSAGKQVYLSGVPGLAAGYYTLLPGIYAQLPGAFLVLVQTSPGAGTVASTHAALPAQPLADGSFRASGFLAAPGTGTHDEHWSIFSVMSDPVARQYSEISDNFANSFFAAQAAANGTTVPRLPEDAGQLSIIASSSLVFEGQGVFNHPNGLGGLADISGNQLLVVDSATRDAINQGTIPIASFIPNATTNIGGDGQAFVAQTSNSTTSVTVGTGNQTFTTQTNLSIFDGQSVTVADSGGSGSSMSGTVVSYDPVTGQLVLNVTQAAGAGTGASWTLTALAASVWKPIVLAASDLDRLGVESLLLGGTRSLQGDGMHFTATASQVVIANNASDPLVLPDIQLIAVPIQQNVTYLGQDGLTPLELPRGVAGTGQVVIAQDAMIEARGAVAPGGAPSFILAPAPVLGQTPGTTLTAGEIASYYQQIVGNEISFVRLSGAGLVTTVGGAADFSIVPVNPIIATKSGNANFSLPAQTAVSSISLGSGAQLIASDSLTLFGNARIASGTVIAAEAAELKSSLISLGSDDFTLPGMVLNQASVDTLAGVKALTLISTSTIDIDGQITLGVFDSSGQPALGSLTFDSAGVIARNAGTATFNAEQVTFQNTGGAASVGTPAVQNASLIVNASDVLGLDSTGNATGNNNATISFGAGAVTLAGFGNGVLLQSSGQIIATGDGGSLNVQSALTLDTPRITAGTVSVVDGLPQFGVESYTITAEDNPASPTNFYPIALINSRGSTPSLPTALLGNSLTITGGDTTISTQIVLPGGVVNLTANGNIAVNSGGAIDVGGQAIQFADTEATIGGGNINLTSVGGAIAIGAGANLDVGDLAGIGAVNPSSAGTLTLTASTGGVTIAAGTLHGQGPDADHSGSFVIDTNTLAPGAAMTYDTLAADLVAGGFETSWNIRARTGDIFMGGLTQARSVTISADTGNVDIAGLINSSAVVGTVGNGGASGNTISISNLFPLALGQAITLRDPNDVNNFIIAEIVSFDPATGRAVFVPVSAGGTGVDAAAQNSVPAGWHVEDSGVPTTGGTVSIFAGHDLSLEASAQIYAHGDIADANGKGGQVLLAASQVGDQQGTLRLNVGAHIDVTADAANGIDSGPVLGGSVIFETSPFAAFSTSSITIPTIASGASVPENFMVQPGLSAISVGKPSR